MIKLTAALSPKPGWSVEEWLAHYRERHAPLTAAVRNFTRHGERYLQNYALHAPEVPDFPDRRDGRVGVTELWFADTAALRAAYEEPDYFTYLRTDELRFCTFDDLVAGVAREVEIFAAPIDGSEDKLYTRQPRVKIFAFRRRASGIDRAAFQAQWQEKRGAGLRAFEPFGRWVRRYVQSHMLDEDVGLPGGVPHDLIDEFYFDSVAEAVAFWGAYHASETIRSEDVALSDCGFLWTVFAREHEVFGPLPAN